MAANQALETGRLKLNRLLDPALNEIFLDTGLEELQKYTVYVLLRSRLNRRDEMALLLGLIVLEDKVLLIGRERVLHVGVLGDAFEEAF